MTPKIPHSPFTTRLSGSAKETELRLRNIFQWKKKRPPVPLFLLTAVLVLSCCGLVSCQVTEPDIDTPMQESANDPTPENTTQPVTGQYASMEHYAQTVMDANTEVSYHLLYDGSATTKTAVANVTDTKIEWLEKSGELPGLAPNGTLESWRFNYLVQIDADPSTIAMPGGMHETDGWFDMEGQGGHNIVALRYEDGSYDILYDEPVNDGMDFYGYHHSYEEAIYDWYVSEYDLDLPLYVIDLLSADENGNHPARRCDGDGWYIYVPITGWYKYDVWDRWDSQYGTNASLTVERCTDRMEDIKAYYASLGAWPYDTDMDAPYDSYYLLNPLGGDTQNEMFFVPVSETTSYTLSCSWNKSSQRKDEREILYAMAASFKVDERITRAPAAEDAELAAVQGTLKDLSLFNITSLTRDDGSEVHELSMNINLLSIFQTAADSLHIIDQPDAFDTLSGGLFLELSNGAHLSFYSGANQPGVLVRYVSDTMNAFAVAEECFELYTFLLASAEHKYLELHDLDQDNLDEVIVWRNENNKRSIVIYDYYYSEPQCLDVNETRNSTASDYTGQIANIKAEYRNMISIVTDNVSQIYRYNNGELTYVCTLSDALR